jgi:hypothetical protein
MCRGAPIEPGEPSEYALNPKKCVEEAPPYTVSIMKCVKNGLPKLWGVFPWSFGDQNAHYGQDNV